MKLRSQMLLAGALTLAVPLVGWQSVKQLYSALQQTRIDEQTLKVANMRLALTDASDIRQALHSGRNTRNGEDWYAEASPYPIFIDGYDDDWQTLVNRPRVYDSAAGVKPADLQVSVRSAQRDDSLYLFISVRDDEVIYHTPPVLQVNAGEGEQPDPATLLVNGDSVELLIQSSANKGDGLQWQHALFRTIAPGAVDVLSASTTLIDGRRQRAGALMRNWQATWEKTAGGFQLEVQLPLPDSGSIIGIAVVDVDASGEARNRWVGNLSPVDMARVHRQSNVSGKSPDADAGLVSAGLLFHDSKAAEQRLQAWVTPGARARLYDIHGRQLADVNQLYTQTLPEDEAVDAAQSSDGIWDAILLRVFAFFVAGDLPLLPETRSTPVSLTLSADRRATIVDDEPVSSRYVTDENDRVLGTLAPVGTDPRRGYLLFEANEEHASAYAGSELARLFTLLLLVSLLAGSGLLIFALVLSSRIRRLSHEAQNAISADGRVRGLPGSDAQDEIGDLSRKLSSLLARSAAYTHYLEALGSRLSHELRTPLSVVRTSIENLDRDKLDEQSRMLIDRASGGTDHLSSIIKALVESTRLEQTVQMADMQRFNLAQWLDGSLARYRQVYPSIGFHSSPDPVPELSIVGSPELLSQAFDKLVDNAVGFASEGPVVLHLRAGTDKVLLAVANRGAPLDEAVLARLFEPMFSGRSADSPGVTVTAQAGRLHLGLGLYIVKMIAEAHDGEVVARNDEGWVLVGMYLPRV